MKRSNIQRTIITLGTIALASGCLGEAPEDVALDSANIESVQDPLCNNEGGMRSVLTALAVATGQELRRWQPQTDFQYNYSTWRLELSSTGKGRCSDGRCANVQALLDMQNDSANGLLTYGDTPLNVAWYRDALRNGYEQQVACNNSGACPTEAHTLSFSHSEQGSCDQKFFFDHAKANGGSGRSRTRSSSGDSSGSTSGSSSSSSGGPLDHPEQLANQLMFAGYPWNTMLNFYLRDGQVSIDPTYGLNEGGTSSSGSCAAACTKFSVANVSGQCCSCNGSNGGYVRSAFSANVYLCR